MYKGKKKFFFIPCRHGPWSFDWDQKTISLFKFNMLQFYNFEHILRTQFDRQDWNIEKKNKFTKIGIVNLSCSQISTVKMQTSNINGTKMAHNSNPNILINVPFILNIYIRITSPHLREYYNNKFLAQPTRSDTRLPVYFHYFPSRFHDRRFVEKLFFHDDNFYNNTFPPLRTVRHSFESIRKLHGHHFHEL